MMSTDTLSCPRDQSSLSEQTLDSVVKVDHCGSCGGVFLDKGELNKIEDDTAREYANQIREKENDVEEAYEMAKQLERPSASCPKCKCEMEKEEYGMCSNVIVDSCPKCGGMWLDHGELKEIMLFFEGAKLETTSLSAKIWASLHNLFSKKQRI